MPVKPIQLACLALAPALLAVAAPVAAQKPSAPKLEFVLEEVVFLAERIPAGKTPLGERFIIPITGGTFEGPGLKGIVMPGGWDWQLLRPDGCLQVKADYFLKTDDGAIINVVNTGNICPGADGKPAPVRTHPVLEAPVGKYEWLGRTAFTGTLEPVFEGGKVTAVRIRFYKAL
jgi:hypothetical protein